MSRAENQLRIFETLWAEIHPHVRSDRNLPARIQQRLAKEKRFGSRDRRFYRELLYTALRHLPWLESSMGILPMGSCGMGDSPMLGLRTLWLAPDTPGTLPLKQQLLAAHPPCPATIAERAALLGEQPSALLPAWFRGHCPAAFEPPNIDALHTRAPLWLRLQTDAPAPIFAEFTARGWTWKISNILPDAIELQAANDPDLTKTEAHQNGLFEIQDLGSQLILPTALSSPSPSALQSFSLFLDACAGAGGKTLQLARLFPNAQIDATDPRPDALAELKTRAARANIKNIRIVPQATLASDNPKSYDAVVVDAPCSGTGTWRRAPHLKYTTTEATIRDATALQQTILRRHAPLVRSNGGLLIYATCSLSRRENEDVVAAFLAEPAHADFALVQQTTILPAKHNTDGFFTATLRRGDDLNRLNPT